MPALGIGIGYQYKGSTRQEAEKTRMTRKWQEKENNDHGEDWERTRRNQKFCGCVAKVMELHTFLLLIRFLFSHIPTHHTHANHDRFLVGLTVQISFTLSCQVLFFKEVQIKKTFLYFSSLIYNRCTSGGMISSSLHIRHTIQPFDLIFGIGSGICWLKGYNAPDS